MDGPNGLKADIEGVEIWAGKDGKGFIVLSNQGADNYAVYRREGDNAFVGPLPHRRGPGARHRRRVGDGRPRRRERAARRAIPGRPARGAGRAESLAARAPELQVRVLARHRRGARDRVASVARRFAARSVRVDLRAPGRDAVLQLGGRQGDRLVGAVAAHVAQRERDLRFGLPFEVEQAEVHRAEPRQADAHLRARRRGTTCPSSGRAASSRSRRGRSRRAPTRECSSPRRSACRPRAGTRPRCARRG